MNWSAARLPVVALVVVLVVALPTIPQSVLAAGCSEKSCYVRAFESVSPTELPELYRVHEIFRNIKQVIGIKETISAELLVIDSDRSPWAVALADNTVVLTKGAVRIFYQDGDYELGDARAAFVIGHELAHVLSNDLFHHRAFTRGSGLEPQPLSEPYIERRADLMGFTYATLADYDTNRLLEGPDHFFNYWIRQIEIVEGRDYPDASARADDIRTSLKAMSKEAEYYRVGLMLAHSGRYLDARNILTDYLKNTEAKTRELYNNLGYVYLQLARMEMSERQAYKYWIPTLLDIEKVETTRGMFGDDIPESASVLLDSAEKYFRIAIEMDDDDSQSLLNLAAVYLYKPDNIHNAYAAIKNAIGKTTAVGGLKTQLDAMYYLILLEDDYDNGDRWTQAKEWYESVVATGNADDNIIYNLARMLDDRGRDDTSSSYWRMLLDIRHDLPDVYRDRVCYRMNVPAADCLFNSQRRTARWPVQDIPIGVDIRVRSARDCIERNWRVLTSKKIGDTSVRIFINDNNHTAVALDHFVEMLVAKDVGNSQYQKVDSIRKRHGEYLAVQPAARTHLVMYKFRGASVLADRSGFVKELWLSNLSNSAELDGCP